ncbi:ATP-binding protein [Chloroflexota bacterium]
MTTELSKQSNPKGKSRLKLTPEESTLIVRIGGFVTMRWIATAGVLVASLVATQVFHIRYPLLPIYVIVACMAFYNFILFIQARALEAEATGIRPGGITVRLRLSLRRLLMIPKTSSQLIAQARAIGNLHIALDLIALTAIIHFTGGISNPFIFFFIFHVIIAGILLHYRVAYVVASSAIFLVLLLVALEYSEVIPHVHLEGFISATKYQDRAYILAVMVTLAVCLYGSAFMVTLISGELRKRQREVVSLRDSAIRGKNKKLKETNKELAKLEEGRKHLLRFLGVVAHDLKAPLSAVQSYLQLMVGGYAGEIAEKPKHMLDRSSQRISELLNLINDLLDISRIEAGQIVSEFEETSLSKTVKDSLENVRDQAKVKKIKLKVAVPKSLPQIMASGARLQQVVTNLLVNAIKFAPEKGVVELRVIDSGSDIRVDVIDNGQGIGAGELPRIFDDFYRGIETTKEGTGLGLSISRRIVEAHQGRIWAESPNPEGESDVGSRLTFTLPKNLVLPDKK